MNICFMFSVCSSRACIHRPRLHLSKFPSSGSLSDRYENCHILRGQQVTFEMGSVVSGHHLGAPAEHHQNRANTRADYRIPANRGNE